MPCNLHYASISDTYGFFDSPVQHLGRTRMLEAESTLKFHEILRCTSLIGSLDIVNETVRKFQLVMKLNEGYIGPHIRHQDPDFRMRGLLDHFLYQYYRYSLCVQGFEAFNQIFSELVGLDPKIGANFTARREIAKTILRYVYPTLETLPVETRFLFVLKVHTDIVQRTSAYIKKRDSAIRQVYLSGIAHKANSELVALESRIVCELFSNSKLDMSFFFPVQTCECSVYTKLGFLRVGAGLERALMKSNEIHKVSLGHVLGMTSWKGNQFLEALNPGCVDRTMGDFNCWNGGRRIVEPDTLLGLGDNGVHICRT